MKKQPPTDERAKVRRSDRAVHDETWIRDLLHRAPLGFLASVEDAQPFINSNLFVYNEEANAIYFHTARRGRTRDNIEKHDEVCFTVAEMGRLLPAKTALEFSIEYRSVVVFGQASLISDEPSAIAALQALLDKYAQHLKPGIDYRPPVKKEMERTSTFRLKIASWSGKMKKVDQFAGAFFYQEPAATMRRRHFLENPDATSFTASHAGYTLSTDPSLLDLDVIHTYLSEHSYWAQGRSRAVVARSIEHSLCFGIYQGNQQVGFARVITDFTVHAYLSDVFVLPEHRGRGLGKWLVASMLAHPLLRGVTKWSLDTRDAQGLYEPFGFESAATGRHMGLRREEN